MKHLKYFSKGGVNYPVGFFMDDAKKMIVQALPVITELVGDNKVNIWCRGSSGAILAGLLVANLKNECTILHVKKEGEDSHSSNSFYVAKVHPAVNIMVDDFVGTGDTVNRIWNEAKHYISVMNILLLDHVCGVEQDCWPIDFVPEYLVTNDDYSLRSIRSCELMQVTRTGANEITTFLLDPANYGVVTELIEQ